MVAVENPFASGVSLGPAATIPILNREEIEAREASKARHPSSQGQPAAVVDAVDDGITDLWIFNLFANLAGQHIAEVMCPVISPHFTLQIPIETFGECAINFFVPGKSLATNLVMHIRGMGRVDHAVDENGEPRANIVLGGEYEWIDNNPPNMYDYLPEVELPQLHITP